VPKPFPDRHIEASLWAVNDRVRNQPAHRFLQDVLGHAIAQLERGGNCPDELYQLVIEQRRARFNRMGHAHPINFRQYVAGQISLAVKIEQPGEALTRTTRGKEPLEML